MSKQVDKPHDNEAELAERALEALDIIEITLPKVVEFDALETLEQEVLYVKTT